MKRTFGVIGLGRFGSSLAKTLFDLGQSVLALDNNGGNVERMKNSVTCAKQVEYNIDSLRESGIVECDTVVVGIGHSLEESVLVTIILKELGIKKIVSRAIDEMHEKILEKLGTERVTNPEKAFGIRMAHQMVSSDILDYIEISPEYSVQQVNVKDEFVDKSLEELHLRRKYDVIVLAIKREDKLIIIPKFDEVLKADDMLVVLVRTEKAQELFSS